jgi:hypothetical protein
MTYFKFYDAVTAVKTANAIAATATHTITFLKARQSGKSFMNNIIWMDDMTPDWFSQGAHLKMDKVHYQHFLRLYNRKRLQKTSTLDKLGYPSVKIQGSYKPAFAWCEANLKPGSFVTVASRFWFAYAEDAVLFKMHWL